MAAQQGAAAPFQLQQAQLQQTLEVLRASQSPSTETQTRVQAVSTTCRGSGDLVFLLYFFVFIRLGLNSSSILDWTLLLLPPFAGFGSIPSDPRL